MKQPNELAISDMPFDTLYTGLEVYWIYIKTDGTSEMEAGEIVFLDHVHKMISIRWSDDKYVSTALPHDHYDATYLYDPDT